MSNICSDNIQCPNGNCVGCRNGQLYCNDPRCYPNCKNCDTTTSSGNWIIVLIILILLGVLLVMSFVIGYDWYNKTKKADEPKNLTVNKHVHNIQQPSIIVNPTLSTPSLSENIIRPISYEGINLSMNESCN